MTPTRPQVRGISKVTELMHEAFSIWKEQGLSSPKAVFEFMRRKARGLDREHFWRIDLDARNKVLGWNTGN